MSAISNNQLCRWHTCDSPSELEQSVLQVILGAAAEAIKVRGEYHIVLTGGRTPRRLYESLRAAATDWGAWHVYYGDERCLPQDDAERNSLMAEQAWLNHVPIPSTQIHPIPAELGAEDAAEEYGRVLANIEQFDTVLLGLGEDGHVASLFPGHDLGNASDAADVIAVHHAPKPPPDRVSLSAQRLSATRQLLFLVAGMAKQQAIHDWRLGVAIPATHVVPGNGVDVYVETALLQATAMRS